MSIRLTELLSKALEVEQLDAKARELTKVGNLRAGNAGVILPDGTPAGSCPRIAHLRSLGLDPKGEISESTLTMWESGIVNETYWVDKLRRIWVGPILCEDEIAVSYETPTGVRLTGRPDIVLCHDVAGTAVPVLGLELKSISSIWTLEKVSLGRNVSPKLEHLAQAGLYSWQLGRIHNLPGPLPYRLIYSAHVNYAGPDWMGTMLRQNYDPTGIVGQHPLVELDSSGKFKNTRPHHMVYELAWDMSEDKSDGVLKFRRENADTYTESPVTWSGIDQYYGMAGDMASHKELPPRPVVMKGDGRKGNFSLCDPRYCTLSEICSTKKNYKEWIKEVRREFGGK